MILKNILRRKGRTLLTILGVSIGVAAIVGLGALANGLDVGYRSMMAGSKADLVLSQPDSMDISYSSVDQEVGAQLLAMPEVRAISGMLEGYVQTEGSPIFFIFGYPEDSFILDRFQIINGSGLAAKSSQIQHGRSLILGSSAAETLKKHVGDSLRVTNSIYRIVGIYETGDAFEDSGAVINIANAQELLGKPRQVSLFYIQLKSPEMGERFTQRAKRVWPKLSMTSAGDFSSKQSMSDLLRGFVWVIAGLAILIGGIGMMNAQLMAVFERTREIGVLRAVGWSSQRVMGMILGESLLICLAGGLVGVGLGWLMLFGFSLLPGFLGATGMVIQSDLLVQAFSVVFILGLTGGLYPAWRAARLQPVEALRYEGGSGGSNVRRLPWGDMAVQSLWQRITRTSLTLGAIGLTVGAMMAMEGVIRGFKEAMTGGWGASSEIMIRQADIADTSLSAIDERIGERIAAMPEVANINGLLFTAMIMENGTGIFIIQGYEPNGYAIRRFNVSDGQRLTSNHQIILGRMMATSMKKKVGETLDLSGVRFRVVGIFESSTGWEEMGGVCTLRDAQSMTGRPRKVMMYFVKLRNPAQASATVEKINAQFSQAHASLSGDFADQMPDMKNMDGMMSAISFVVILVGGMGVMNTMLMAVLERTREIGVLRALGWRSRAVLGLILQESLLIGLLGGFLGIGIVLSLAFGIRQVPDLGRSIPLLFSWDIYARTILIASLLGLVGGLYPAYRAIRLQPVEALRYE